MRDSKDTLQQMSMPHFQTSRYSTGHVKTNRRSFQLVGRQLYSKTLGIFPIGSLSSGIPIGKSTNHLQQIQVYHWLSENNPTPSNHPVLFRLGLESPKTITFISMYGMDWTTPCTRFPSKIDGYEEAHERTISLHGTSSPKPCQHRKQNRLSVIPAIVIPSQPGRKTPYILWWLQPQTLMMAKSLLEYITKIPLSLSIYIYIRIYIYMCLLQIIMNRFNSIKNEICNGYLIQEP